MEDGIFYYDDGRYRCPNVAHQRIGGNMIENRNPDSDYELACFHCGTKSGLTQVAHRNFDSFIVGYLFLCAACLEVIGGKYYVELIGTEVPAHVGRGYSATEGNTSSA